MLLRTLIFSLLLGWSALGQNTPKTLDFNEHVWAAYSGDHEIAGKWGLHFDAQWRRADIGTEWQQYQIRPGLNYRVSPNLLLTLGYAYTHAYPYGDFPVLAAFPEHRIYQQALITHGTGRLRFQHRVRMEQRFIRYPTTPDETTYQNRFRYLARLELPLIRRSSGSEWYLAVSDEILVGIPPNYGARPFDQNRLFAGVGRSANGVKTELGYMLQFIGQRNGNIFEWNNTIVFNVTSGRPLWKLWGRTEQQPAQD